MHKDLEAAKRTELTPEDLENLRDSIIEEIRQSRQEGTYAI